MTPNNHPLRSRLAKILRTAAPLAAITLATIILLCFPPAQYSFYPQCPIRDLFDLQCPGCGGTRAVAALLQGRLSEAMHLNALVTLLFPFAVGYGILGYIRSCQRKTACWPQPPLGVIYAAIAVAAVFTVIRNLPPHSF